MPASNERVPNRPLSGQELSKIIVADVQDILMRDGMFTNNIAYSRVKYEVRVTMHLDNPSYPQHIATITGRPQSVQQIEANPAMASLEPGGGPLKEPSDGAIVVSTEAERTIQSPNAARVEHDLPLKMVVRDPGTGASSEKDIKYTGDPVDPASVGNTASMKDVSDVQARTWGVQVGDVGSGEEAGKKGKSKEKVK